MATFNWPFQFILQQGENPSVIEGPPQVRPAGEETTVPRVIQVGTIGEFLGSVDPQKKTQGQEEGLGQCWEAQWQEVLKAVQPNTFGQEALLQSKTLSCDDTKASSKTLSDSGQWPRSEGYTQLVAEDDGGGLQALIHLPNGENTAEKKDPMRKEALDAEMQRQCFRQLNYLEAEGPRKVCGQLQELCHRWLRPERHTKEQILELVILEQFLAILPQEVQSWLRNCCPQACSHAVVLVEDFLRSQQQETKMVMPCKDEIVVSDTEEYPLGSGSGHFGWETKQENRWNSSLPGKDRSLHVDPVSPGEGILNGHDLDPSQQRGSGSLESHCGPQQECKTEPPPTWEEITHCDEGVYETVVHLEDHKHWCLECGESFPDASQLLEHQKTHPQHKRPECPKCGKNFRDLSHVIRHQTVHTGEKPYSCFDCGQSFTQKPALMKHQQKHQGVQTGFQRNVQHQRNRSTVKRPQCQECGKSFRDISHVIRHQTVHTGEKPYKCSECGQCFTQKPALTRHQQKHLESQPYTAGNGELCVYQENSCFDPLEALHRSSGTSQENTSSVFTNGCKVEHQPMKKPHRNPMPKGGGKRPLKKNADRRGQKNYWCTICGKGFRDKADVVRHQRIHTGEKPYNCLDCGRRFTTTSSLYKHQEIHNRPDLKADI